MASLKEVRKRIVSVRSTQQITKAMKVVSAAKLRKAQSRIIQLRPYALKLRDMLSNLADSLEGSEAKRFYQERPVSRVLLLMVTSDRGLAGSFNGAVNKEAFRNLQARYGNLDPKKIDVIAVGRKARDFFRKTRFNLIQEHTTLFNDLTYEASEEISSFVLQQFLSGAYDVVEVAYNQFKNAAVFIPTFERFLPVPSAPKDEKAGTKTFRPDFIFEPSKEEILGKLLDQSLKVNFFRYLLESNAAEHGARMTAMDKASENAEDLLRSLRLMYNKERQATITKEILEIVSGAQALNA